MRLVYCVLWAAVTLTICIVGSFGIAAEWVAVRLTPAQKFLAKKSERPE